MTTNISVNYVRGKLMDFVAIVTFPACPAQCVSEAALTLLLDRKDLPPRSADGFGTPAELLGKPLLSRLQNTSVRPVDVETNVRKGVGREWRMYPGQEET